VWRAPPLEVVRLPPRGHGALDAPHHPGHRRAEVHDLPVRDDGLRDQLRRLERHVGGRARGRTDRDDLDQPGRELADVQVSADHALGSSMQFSRAWYREAASDDNKRRMPETSWTVVEPSLPALTCTYSFGPGIARSLALVVDGGVVVVSPPCKPPESAFSELTSRGPVKALVASNAYHHLGLPPWKARFPDAQVFAPAQSIARVEKQSGVTGIRPLVEASSLVGDRVELVDMPHYKTGEVLVRWKIEDRFEAGSVRSGTEQRLERGVSGPPIENGYAWYVTDVMFNFPKLPNGPFGWITKWTRSGPGLRRNALAGSFMVKDKRALYAWLGEQADKTPPRMVVACHLDVARLADPGAEIRAALA
jgi:hypothetical protein